MQMMSKARQIDFETTSFSEENYVVFFQKKMRVIGILKHPDFKKSFDGKKFSAARIKTYVEKKLLAMDDLVFKTNGISGVINCFNFYIEESKLSQRKTIYFEDREYKTKTITLSTGETTNLEEKSNLSSWSFDVKDDIFIHDNLMIGLGKDANDSFILGEIETKKEKLLNFDEEVKKILKFEEDLQIYYNLKVQEISQGMRNHIKIKI